MKKKRYELRIIKEKSEFLDFNIYNTPKQMDKINYLKLLQKLNLKDYEFKYSFIKEAVKSLNYYEIIDKIMEIGISQLSLKLIKVLYDRKIDIYEVSKYLEKNKNSKFKIENYSEISTDIIFYLTKLDNDNKEEKEDSFELDYSNNRDCLLCCDKNIPINLYLDNYKKDLIPNTIKNLDRIFEINKLKDIKKNIKDKLDEYNKTHEEKLSCILTDTTVKKIYQLEFGIKANIPMIIQGFTSAGKSFLSKISCKINKKEYLSTALSEHTTIEDLLGRDNIKNDSSIAFIPGILLIAYTEGKTLILDECDLAKPEILSCILGSIFKDELIINNTTFRKMEGYNVILTMNGEVKGFNEKQRNILTSNILSKFIIIQFDEMEKEECKEIFKNLLSDNKNSKDNYLNKLDTFIELHQKMIDEMKKNEKLIDPIVTLRNLNYCYYFNKISISPRIAAEISYTARFPKNERNNFEIILKKFGKFQMEKNLEKEIEIGLKENFLYYNESYKKAAYLALIACREGLHPLLIGKKGCGLTTFARLIASIYQKDKKDYEFLFCCPETSVEDLIGCYQPEIKKSKNENDYQNLSSYIKWNDGPILRACKNGISVILDNINYSKPQVIEYLNPLLENNSKYNENTKYNIIEKENISQKGNDDTKKDNQLIIEKGFIIIGTMAIDENNFNNQISKSLMNRFVAIYLDEYLEIKNSILNTIIDNTANKLNSKIKEPIKNNENEDEDEEDDDDEDAESDEEEENEEEDEEENNKIPNWFNIQEISNKTIKEIKEFYKNKKSSSTKSIKSLIKEITKLSLTYERINHFGFSLKECYDFINFDFNGKKEKYKKLQNEILKTIKKDKKNQFFFDDFESDSWKMIMILISSNISNTSIFLQGSPGSGKSCAAKHYGANRSFNNRDPILSINCHRDLKFDYLVGNYNFKNSKFHFIDGPLLTSMKNGEPILLDEFNLCSEDVLMNLLPILKANINEKINLKGVPKPIYIKPGFLLIATGNFAKEKGRNTISSIITEEIKIQEICNINFEKNIKLLKNILEEEYREIYNSKDSIDYYKISPYQIQKIHETLTNIAQFNLSLRQIKCLFERITRFCLEDNYETSGFKKIPVIYVIISYILPQLKIGEKTLFNLLKEFNSIMGYNNIEEIMNFINSKVEFEQTYINANEKKKFIKKGKIFLETKMNEENMPQVLLQTYFWIRMSCSLKNEVPSEENLLLAGPTSYKEYLLNEWLRLKVQKENIDTFYLTKHTETENLIGTSSLDDEKSYKLKLTI